jgi:hypothetical protein
MTAWVRGLVGLVSNGTEPTLRVPTVGARRLPRSAPSSGRAAVLTGVDQLTAAVTRARAAADVPWSSSATVTDRAPPSSPTSRQQARAPPRTFGRSDVQTSGRSTPRASPATSLRTAISAAAPRPQPPANLAGLLPGTAPPWHPPGQNLELGDPPSGATATAAEFAAGVLLVELELGEPATTASTRSAASSGRAAADISAAVAEPELDQHDHGGHEVRSELVARRGRHQRGGRRARARPGARRRARPRRPSAARWCRPRRARAAARPTSARRSPSPSSAIGGEVVQTAASTRSRRARTRGCLPTKASALSWSWRATRDLALEPGELGRNGDAPCWSNAGRCCRRARSTPRDVGRTTQQGLRRSGG